MGIRGRPKKAPPPVHTEVELKIGEFLAQFCGIPGCKPGFHVDEAGELIRFLSKNGYIIRSEN